MRRARREEGRRGREQYRLLSNALLWGHIQRCYLWEPQGVEEPTEEESAADNRFMQSCNMNKGLNYPVVY